MPLEFTFLRPWWLLLLPLGLILAYAVTTKSQDSWRRFCDVDLLPHLVVVTDRASNRWAQAVIAVAWLLAVVALAGPAWDKEKTVLFENGEAMVVVFDLSESMNSLDLQPSRLERARYKAIEIIENETERAVGLVVFAGSAFKVTPVSDDVATVTHLMQSLNTNMMPVQGGTASKGLEYALDLLQGSGYDTGKVVLVTDGIDAEADDVAQRIFENGYRLSVVAVGTQNGAPIKLENGDFLRSQAGDLVISNVDFESLSKLAAVGGGEFLLISDQASRLQYGERSEMVRSTDKDEVSTENWKDRGPWLLLLLLPLVALMFRRGWLLCLSFVFVFGAQDVNAFDWSHLWQRSDQRAAEAVHNEIYDDESLVRNRAWRGVANYRLEEFENAIKDFTGNDKITLYNRGNALAKTGDLQSAIEHYDSAIRLDPQFEDAIHNREIVMNAMQKQQLQGQSSDSRDQQNAEAQESESRKGELEGMPQNSGEEGEIEQQRQGQQSQRSGQQAMGESPEGEEELYLENKGNEENLLLQDDVSDELNQVMEQWLRVIPDDPGGLLRRKFYYDYESRS